MSLFRDGAANDPHNLAGGKGEKGMTVGKFQMSDKMPASKVLDGLHALVSNMKSSVFGTTRVCEAERRAYDRVLHLLADIEIPDRTT